MSDPTDFEKRTQRCSRAKAPRGSTAARCRVSRRRGMRRSRSCSGPRATGGVRYVPAGRRGRSARGGDVVGAPGPAERRSPQASSPSRTSICWPMPMHRISSMTATISNSTNGPRAKWTRERSEAKTEPDEDLLEFLGGIDEVERRIAGRRLLRFPRRIPISTNSRRCRNPSRRRRMRKR